MSFISFFFSFFICCPYGKNLNMVFCSSQMIKIIQIFETIDNKRIDVKHGVAAGKKVETNLWEINRLITSFERKGIGKIGIRESTQVTVLLFSINV